jgi:cytoskeletal protein CcmA (bactofilin family)
MFDKKPKSYTDLLGKTNRIVEGTTITGNIISQADFRLDGMLIGDFTSNGKIVVGPEGSIKGKICCQNADIEGKLEGILVVEDLLSLKATAVIIGDVICEKLSVEPGAVFQATCKMKSDVKNLIFKDEQPTQQKQKAN